MSCCLLWLAKKVLGTVGDPEIDHYVNGIRSQLSYYESELNGLSRSYNPRSNRVQEKAGQLRGCINLAEQTLDMLKNADIHRDENQKFTGITIEHPCYIGTTWVAPKNKYLSREALLYLVNMVLDNVEWRQPERGATHEQSAEESGDFNASFKLYREKVKPHMQQPAHMQPLGSDVELNVLRELSPRTPLL